MSAIRLERVHKGIVDLVPGKGVGMKRMMTGTTAYYLPGESARLHSVAKKMGTSLQEATIRAWARLLSEPGTPLVCHVPGART